MVHRIYSLNQYLQEQFGQKVYKLALDGGMTCPNRDGTLDSRGCIFCSRGGSGEFAQRRSGSVTQQINAAIQLIQQKTNANRFIAYFQSYTNTYAPAAYLEQLFTEAVSDPRIAVLSIATRPDCLGGEILELLQRLNQIKPVWVELGLQTIHPETARYIRRGYELACYELALTRLRQGGIHVVTHVILGLPGESREDMLATIDYLSGQFRPDGIKLQLLHILEGTDLAEEYRAGKIRVMTPEEYMDVLFECIERLPPDMVIHRLTGDGPKSILIAPLWTADKKRVLNMLHREMEKRDILQGKKWNPRRIPGKTN